ncbi:bifunctional acetate--CoA ligase family protein/GNAT family N-acetyltransferase [Neisseria animaloris]|uniref:Acetyltransferase n=1 Tax=Neisseria animaloris TaxID=326522 RepID=A0A448UD95_9NEIS|nr:GNAT family N-acetyltransferase [Neisseria animaloris]VEJ21876.1 acetyltransferase [Neisseria animaloris]
MPNQPPASLFTPARLIVVGASERPHSLGERVLTALLSTPFCGQITPVNLRHKTVGGLKAYANIGRVPETADAAIILTPPPSYEALFKACHKQQIPYAVLVQDWDNLCAESWAEAQTAIEKARKLDLRIAVCHPAAIQMPAAGLNTGIYPAAPAGNVAVISGHASFGAELTGQLQQAGLGISRHICINFALSPIKSADILHDFAVSPDTHFIVAEYNPNENLRRLFSTLRQTARRKPVILHVSRHADAEEQAILHYLSQHCGCLLTFTREELTAALHALGSRNHTARKLHVIANEPCGWLQTQAASLGLSLQLPPDNDRPSENSYGYIGSNPSTMHYRALAESCLQHNQTEALLAIVSRTADGSEAEITRILSNLQARSEKPVLISSPFSDGLLQFKQATQALQAFQFQSVYNELKRLKIQTAKPYPAYLKTPTVGDIQEALGDLSQLAKALYLPEYKTREAGAQIEFIFRRHHRYGGVLYAFTAGRTLAVLPPFTTIDAERLIQQTDSKRHQKTIHQLLHSLNTVADNMPRIDTIAVSIVNGSPGTDITLTTENSTAENVLAPYPIQSAHNFTLKNGQTLHIRPLIPEDAESKQQFVQNMNETDRHSRYMMYIKALSPAMLSQACNLDYCCEGAFTAESEDGTLLGVSRFSGTDSPGQCEFGIGIATAAQGQGLAVHLMQQIIGLAKQQGYRQMTAEILKTNRSMLKLAEKLGFETRPSPHDKELVEACLNLFPPANNIKRNFRQQILAKKP